VRRAESTNRWWLSVRARCSLDLFKASLKSPSSATDCCGAAGLERLTLAALGAVRTGSWFLVDGDRLPWAPPERRWDEVGEVVARPPLPPLGCRLPLLQQR
jgi:hypothetical protein